MILLALLLASFGAADLTRPQDRAPDRVALLRAALVGATVLGLGVWGTGLEWWWVAAGLALLVAWIATTPVGISGRQTYPWPLVLLGMTVLTILAFGSQVRSADGWLPDWYDQLDISTLDDVSFVQFAVGVGVVLFLVESANIIVRMVLAGTDAGVMASEQTLRGGRVLGPIERIFIFAMALAGEYAALTAVIAAKGILRFPEISRDVAGRKAEYVLVGSFVSWSIALVFIPLL
ncbi:hypothetical protein [Aeromicrobium sp.]|uniref:hypothetical protein n=1 Tax=Aeromicrobium sp. TaxID=1871063 RepID=UPI00199E4691|nr:hypothetical protein [Aeromicrobium sp.]MBC7633457.1 hypothetical protein [Aeromicrobium sp.]